MLFRDYTFVFVGIMWRRIAIFCVWCGTQDLYEDLKRRKDDHAENTRLCNLSHQPGSKPFEACQWQDCAVGSAIKVRKGEAFPVDISLGM